MNIRSVMFAAPWLLAAALSSGLAFASDEEAPVKKPECSKGQVWDSKTQKCVLQTSNPLPALMVAPGKLEKIDS